MGQRVAAVGLYLILASPGLIGASPGLIGASPGLIGASPGLIGASAARVGGSDLARRIDREIARGGLRRARVGILVRDAGSDEVLYQRDPTGMYLPASITKLFTAAAALHYLSPQYRFRVELFGVGRRRGDVFDGDLYLRAEGDPVFVEERVWKLIQELRKSGIRRVTGALRVDDSFFDGEHFGYDWGPRSRAWYHAPHGAVSVNFNTVPVRGRYLAIRGDPSLNAGRVVVRALGDDGIEVVGGVEVGRPLPEGAVRLAQNQSRPLGAIVADLNKVSNNVIAEQLLKTLGARTAGAPGTAAKGLAAIGRYLDEIGIEDGYELYDGSGLSRADRLSPRAVVELLDRVAARFDYGAEFQSSLKVAGAEGSSARFQDPLCQRRMRVKTGHLYATSTLAGFAETAGGRRLVFAVLANDYRRGRAAADRAIERICEAFLDDRAAVASVEANTAPRTTAVVPAAAGSGD